MIITNTISESSTFHYVIKIYGMKTLGSRIAHYRNLAGLSQGALAKACGWKSQSRIGNYELNTREPTLADITLIAKALHVSTADLVLNHESGPANPEPNLQLGEAGTSRSPPIVAQIIAEAFAAGKLTASDIEELRRMALHLIKKNAQGATAATELPEHLDGLAEAALKAAENGDNSEDLLKMVGHGLKKSQPKEGSKPDGKRKARNS